MTFRNSRLPAVATAAAILSIAATATAGNRLDEAVQTHWKVKNLTPVARSTDTVFIRRVYLDLVGTIPTRDETVAFLADVRADKRTRLIDQLLKDRRFAEQQALIWDLIMFGRHPLNPDAVRKRDDFRKWLADKIAADVPYDRWVRDVLRAEEQGSETFLVQFRNQPDEATTAVSRIFMGMQLQCAKCHDHPYDVWTQKDFYGMSGFFVRLVINESAGTPKKYRVDEKSTGEVLFTGAAKDQKPGQKGEPIKPKFLGGKVLEEPPVPKDFKEPKDGKGLPKPLFSRKDRLADWMVSAENPYFAKALANRLWAQFLGRGLVHPVDDLGEANKPQIPAAMEMLTKAVVEHRYDLRKLIREIVTSDTYQLGDAGPMKEALPVNYDRARVRPLSAEEMVASARTACGPEPAGTKLDAVGWEYFVRYFGEPTNGLGEFQGSLSEHLFMNNGDQLRAIIRRKKGNLIDTLMTVNESTDAKIDRLFLAVLSRPPSENERKRFVQHIGDEKMKVEPRWEEAVWALLNTAEFRFNH